MGGRAAAKTHVPILCVENLTVEVSTDAGRAEVVRDLSLSLDSSEVLAILGESGSGKSVTALAMLGLLSPRSARVRNGRVLLRGEDVLTMSRRERRDLLGRELAIVFQDPFSSLNPVLRVGNQISEIYRRRCGYSRAKSRAAAISLMDQVGIPDASQRYREYPHQFSGGMRQRVIIAMALALDPSVLIADEPTTALDVTIQAEIMELLAELRRSRGLALILITHDLGVVADIADRVAVMYGGRIVESGSLRDVYDSPAHPYTDGLLASVPRIGMSAELLSTIPGAPPNPDDFPAGCAFHPRCPLRTLACQTELPELRRVPGAGDERWSACHHSDRQLAEGGQRYAE